jgi:hypothetical protein
MAHTEHHSLTDLHIPSPDKYHCQKKLPPHGQLLVVFLSVWLADERDYEDEEAHE